MTSHVLTRFARRSAASAVLSVALAGSFGSAQADIDKSTFPADIRAIEWREVGPFRGGRSAAVTGIPGDRDRYYFGAAG
ncbi:MAG TPA: hypothetical protein VJ906_08500, partial [Roseovarius sp.]|nr:hypothetical protein [Roseovarius sp.]